MQAEDLMTYRLRSGLSFCRQGGRTIFLDVDEDRYFELAPPLAALLDRVVADDSERVVASLVERGLVVTAEPGASPITAFSWPAPHSSRLETATPGRLRPFDLVVAAFTLTASAMRLRRRSLRQILERIARRRPRLTEAVDGQATACLADRFLAARRWLPLAPVCLRDSLALIEYLALKGVAADLVVGIEAAPFSAHCWVQSGLCALNETVHQARRHTPILAV
jgi:hypothetical protein